MIRLGPSGGIAGEVFHARHTASSSAGKKLTPTWRIAQVKGNTLSHVGQLEVVWVNSRGEVDSSPEFGKAGGFFHENLDGSPFEFTIDADDFLTRLTGTLDTSPVPPNEEFAKDQVFVAAIQFGTANGKTSPAYGASDLSLPSFEYSCPEGFHIIGLYGRVSEKIDAIGVYIDERARRAG